MLRPLCLWVAGAILALVTDGARGEALAGGVRSVISAPDGQLDFEAAKLAFDLLIDPTIDVPAIRREIDALAGHARSIATEGASDEAKLNAVRRVVYTAGAWNGHRPFGYDHADPLGLDVRNKLLSTYLRTRSGNCVSMPTLFLILAERLGLNVSFATAPLHVFVRYTDLQGRAFNIETTSGANLARLEWYRLNLPMTDRALETGLYMRTLTRRESVAHMAATVMDWALDNGRYQESIDVAGAILEHFPRDGYTMAKRGHAYGELLRVECIERFPSLAAVPASIRARCDDLAANNAQDFERAEGLGWQPST